MFMYVNGQLVDQSEAKISPFDHGYLYGVGVFETIRTYDGIPFLLEEHMERLNDSLKELQIECSLQVEDVYAIIQQLCEHNQLQDTYLRINISAGIGEVGLQVPAYEKPTVIIFQKPLPPLQPLAEKEAVILTIKRNTPETKQRLKSHHFLNNIAAKREIGADLLKEGVFLTQDGKIAEGITSNIFWIKDHQLFTPTIDTGILNGITRQLIIRLANKLGLSVKEGLYNQEELAQAEEIFFTNSIQEITPVNQLANRQYPGKMGKKTVQLYELYQQAINQYKNECKNLSIKSEKDNGLNK